MSSKLQMPDGTRVRTGEIHEFPLHHESQRAIVPVFGQRGRTIVGLGTAVCVGPGWFVTARHVVADWEANTADAAVDYPRLWIYLETDEPFVDGHDSGFYGGLCEVRRISSHTEVDLANLTVEMPGTSHARLRHLTVALRMPEVGEPVSVIGYPDMSVEGDIDSESVELLLDRVLAVSVGEVTQQQHERVSRAFRESPGFAMNAPVKSGMSGGAVIDHREHVIGFATSSIEPTREYPEWSSWAAGVAAALELDFSLQADGLKNQHYSMADIVSVGGIECEVYRSFSVDEATGNSGHKALPEGVEDTVVTG